MVELDTDLVEKSAEKRLNMEYDWKRKPLAARQCVTPNHLAFSTVPWDSVEEFLKLRDYWETIWTSAPYCLRTVDDFKRLAIYVLSQSSLGKANARYLNSKTPDITRLRQSLGAAWRHSKAGLIYHVRNISNREFAAYLEECGIPCTRADVENDGKKPFTLHRCPPTPAVADALIELRTIFPELRVEEFMVDSDTKIDLAPALVAECELISRL